MSPFATAAGPSAKRDAKAFPEPPSSLLGFATSITTNNIKKRTPGAGTFNSTSTVLRSKSLGAERADDESANPSLHYLIARVRRGGENQMGSYSATASPSFAHQKKRMLSLDFGNLSRQQPLLGQEVVDQACAALSARPTSRSNSWIPSDVDESNDEGDLAEWEGYTLTGSTLEDPSQQAFDMLVAGGSTGNEGTSYTSATHETAAKVNKHPALQLPDPSTIEDRRELFATSRKMCSRSTIDSFEKEDEDDDARNGLHGPSQHKRNRMMDDNSASVSSHSMSSAEDDDQSLDSVPRHSCDHAAAPPRRRGDDHSSIAFSVDSVHVRRTQFSNSQVTGFATGDDEDDFALEDLDDGADDEMHPHYDRSRPSHIFGQQAIYEFDMASVHLRFQRQANLNHEGDDEMQL